MHQPESTPGRVQWFGLFRIAVIIRENYNALASSLRVSRTSWHEPLRWPDVHDSLLKIHSEFKWLLNDIEMSWVAFALSETYNVTHYRISDSESYFTFFGPLHGAWIETRIHKNSYFSKPVATSQPSEKLFLAYVERERRDNSISLTWSKTKFRQLKKYPSSTVKKIHPMAFSWIFSKGPVNF